jgi:hypothetical protein
MHGKDTLEADKKSESICTMIASIICDQKLGEKSIIGRLGLFIKRAQLIEGGRDLTHRPLSMLLGKNYE